MAISFSRFRLDAEHTKEANQIPEAEIIAIRNEVATDGKVPSTTISFSLRVT